MNLPIADLDEKTRRAALRKPSTRLRVGPWRALLSNRRSAIVNGRPQSRPYTGGTKAQRRQRRSRKVLEEFPSRRDTRKRLGASGTFTYRSNGPLNANRVPKPVTLIFTVVETPNRPSGPGSCLVPMLRIRAVCCYQVAGRGILFQSQQQTLKLCHGSRRTMRLHEHQRLRL